jgi:hypothetical protein
MVFAVLRVPHQNSAKAIHGACEAERIPVTNEIPDEIHSMVAAFVEVKAVFRTIPENDQKFGTWLYFLSTPGTKDWIMSLHVRTSLGR